MYLIKQIYELRLFICLIITNERIQGKFLSCWTLYQVRGRH